MKKISIQDEYGNVDSHYQNDNDADIFVEKFLMTAADPDSYTITTEDYDEFNEGVMRKLGEDLQKGDPVEFYNWYYENYVRKGKTVIDDLQNDFDCRLMHTALFGEGNLVVLYVDDDNILQLRTGGKAKGQLEWSKPIAIEGEYVPSNIYVEPLGEGSTFLVLTQGEGGVGFAYIVAEGVISERSEFSSGQAIGVSALNMPGVEGEGMFFLVSYQDSDGWGYTRLGSCPWEGEPAIEWHDSWKHSEAESRENRLCHVVTEGNVFGIFYSRGFKGYVRTADISEELLFVDQSVEVVCANTICENMQPALVTAEYGMVVLAYADVLDSGKGVMCVGSFSHPGHPIFNPMDRAFFNSSATRSITISHPPYTMPDDYFTLSWIDAGDRRQTYFDLCAVYDMMPQSLAGRRIIDHFPGLEVSHQSFGYAGDMDIVIIFTIDEGYGEFSTYNLAAINPAEIKPILGVMAEDGLEGETKRVHFFGEVIDYEDAIDGTPVYLDRDMKACYGSPFPFGVGLSLSKLLLTRTPER